MTWDFLCLLAGVSCCSGIILALDKYDEAGVIGIVAALASGLVVFLTQRRIGRCILDGLELYESKLPFWKLLVSWSLFLAAFVWSIAAGVFGFWLTGICV